MKLIINADDFGLTKGVSEGILDCIEKGIVTSTTAMVNGLYFEKAIEEAKKRNFKNIGVHLTLTWGKPTLPVNKIQSLVDNKGCFYKRTSEDKPNYEEVREELRAQIELFLSTGIKPTHLDGHHHFYAFDEEILNVVLDLSREYNLPLRGMPELMKHYTKKGVRSTEVFTSEFYNENAEEGKLLDIISKYKHFNTVEIMCHPAYVDEDLINATSYNKHRKQEFQILISEKIKEFINKENIELIAYNEL
ncbi:YdjC-like protein [Clostridiales bacterium oral taxon 876 str. F0540]|nr:YdjC-like protein [Clostridiales bacterium oral taxon 876 str. F0540]